MTNTPIPSLLSSESRGIEVTQLCLTLCDPMDCSLQGYSVHWIFQASILEWVAISFSRGSSRPRDWTQVSHIVGRRFTVWVMYIVCRLKKFPLPISYEYSCLENPMGEGAWQAVVHGVAKSQTRLSDFTVTFQKFTKIILSHGIDCVVFHIKIHRYHIN